MPDNEPPESLDDAFERKKREIADQKDPQRLQDPKRAKFASLKFGRPELVDEDGSVMVWGMDAASQGLVARDAVTASPAQGPAAGQTTAKPIAKKSRTKEFVRPQEPPMQGKPAAEDTVADEQAESITDFIEQFFDEYDTVGPAVEPVTSEAAESAVSEGDDELFPWQSSSEVQYPDGTTRLFEYDDDGLFRVTNPDRTVLQKCLDGSWIEFDANGDLTETIFSAGAVDVDAIGDFTVQNADGSALEHWSDGTKIETDVAGVSVTTNPDGSRAMLHWGLAYLVTHPDGGTRSFDYDVEGKLYKIQESQTGICFETKGDTWYKYLDVNEEGMTADNILEEFTGNVRVDVTGRVRIDSSDKTTIIYPDGRTVVS